MNNTRREYYPTILQAIHLIILYIFIQTVVDFPLALYDYYNDTEYLYLPIKKVLLGVGSTVFILVYGIIKSKSSVLEVFPLRLFNPLLIAVLILFFWGAHNWLAIINARVDQFFPAPYWFWELFNKVFESDYGWWGAFFRVSIVAPLVEELIFRGLILHGLRKNYNSFTAVVVSALLFALFHLNPWQFPATFVLGLLLGWLMIRTNSIILAFLGHAFNNLMVLLSITYYQEIQSFAIYLMDRKDFLLLSTFAVALALILMYLLTMKKKESE